MRTEHKVLVKRDKAKGHEESLVIVNWEGMNSEDVRRLAELYVVHAVERYLKSNDHALAESYEVRASDYKDRTPYDFKPINLPKQEARVGKPSKASRELLEALKGLSQAEIQTLFGEANQGI